MATPEGTGADRSFEFLEIQETIQALRIARDKGAAKTGMLYENVTADVLPVLFGDDYPAGVEVRSYPSHNPKDVKGVMSYLYFYEKSEGTSLRQQSLPDTQLMRINPDTGELAIDNVSRAALRLQGATYHPILKPIEDHLNSPEIQAFVSEETTRLRAIELAEEEKVRIKQEKEVLHTFIVEQPLEAMQTALSQVGITSIERVDSLSPQQVDDLVFVSHVVLSRMDKGVFGSNELTGIAHSVLDRALLLKREGVEFTSYVHNNYHLAEYEKRPIMQASSPDDFWDQLSQYTEWHTVSSEQVSDIYSSWKSDFLRKSRRESAHSVLGGTEGVAKFLPEGFTKLEVLPRQASVTYEDPDTLLADMGHYFVPRSHNFDADIAAHQAISNAVGDTNGIGFLLAQLNDRVGGDAANMQRITEEVKAWDVTHEPYYKDSYDTGYDDPYEYTGGMFTGHGIGIGRQGDHYSLTLYGRGYNYNQHNPVDLIEDFAFLSGREVTYGGSLTVEYGNEFFVPETVINAISDRGGPEKRTLMSVDYGAVARSLNALVGGKITDLETAAKVMALPDGDVGLVELEIPGVRIASSRTKLHNQEFNAAELVLSGDRYVYEAEGGVLSSKLPEIELKFDSLPGKEAVFNDIARRAVAARTLLDNVRMQ